MYCESFEDLVRGLQQRGRARVVGIYHGEAVMLYFPSTTPNAGKDYGVHTAQSILSLQGEIPFAPVVFKSPSNTRPLKEIIYNFLDRKREATLQDFYEITDSMTRESKREVWNALVFLRGRNHAVHAEGHGATAVWKVGDVPFDPEGRPGPKKSMDVYRRRASILQVLRQGEASKSQIANQTQLPERQVERMLYLLKRDGIAERYDPLTGTVNSSNIHNNMWRLIPVQKD